jgi:hypothetical protein
VKVSPPPPPPIVPPLDEDPDLDRFGDDGDNANVETEDVDGIDGRAAAPVVVGGCTG